MQRWCAMIVSYKKLGSITNYPLIPRIPTLFVRKNSLKFLESLLVLLSLHSGILALLSI
nr:MAG TPA: hypothetical protein [Caudoviricetes sp.]